MDFKNLELWAKFKDPNKKIIALDYSDHANDKEFDKFKVGSISWTTKKVRVDMSSVGMSGFSPHMYKFDEIEFIEED